MRFTHTGETGRLPGQIIACLASLGGALLVWTGLSLALRRLRAWRARSRSGEAIASEYAALVPRAITGGSHYERSRTLTLAVM